MVSGPARPAAVAMCRSMAAPSSYSAGRLEVEIRLFDAASSCIQGPRNLVTRFGWTPQGGFDIYLNDATLREPLWAASSQQTGRRSELTPSALLL